MARYPGKKQVSAETRDEARAIARGTQRPGQTKEQTRLIAQGIERGIALYKKEQKEKARARDRRARGRPASANVTPPVEAVAPPVASRAGRPAWLPWLLLALTWAGIGVFWLLQRA